jgi:hypothetical protein
MLRNMLATPRGMRTSHERRAGRHGLDMQDTRGDVHKWLDSLRQAIDAQADPKRWESVKQAIESQADPKRWESIKRTIETQTDVPKWLESVRQAIESQADPKRIESIRRTIESQADLKRLDPRRPAPFWQRPEGATTLGLLMLGVGAAIGYVLAYFLDPVAGRGRRVQTVEKLRAWLRRTERRAEGLATHAGNKMQGVKHEASQRVAIPVGGEGDSGDTDEQRGGAAGPEVVNLP